MAPTLCLRDRCFALRQYDAKPDLGYLPLKPNQEVTVQYIGESDEADWLYGSAGGHQGWFPRHCIVSAPRSPPPPTPPPPGPPPAPLPSPEAVRQAARAVLELLSDDDFEEVIREELGRRPCSLLKAVVSTAPSSPEVMAQEWLQDTSCGDICKVPELPLPKAETNDSHSVFGSAVKRTFCKFWQEGKCSKGEACTFAHAEHEIGQPIVDSSWAPAAHKGQSNDFGNAVARKKTLCRFWQEGKCAKGSGCTYAHGEQEIGQPINAEATRLGTTRRVTDVGIGNTIGVKWTLCKFWQDGKCSRGEACTFAHGLDEIGRPREVDLVESGDEVSDSSLPVSHGMKRSAVAAK